MKVKSQSEVTQSCPTLRDPMDCSLPGSSIHGIFQTRVLEWGALPSLINYYNVLCISVYFFPYLYIFVCMYSHPSVPQHTQRIGSRTHSRYPNPWMLKSHSQLSVSAVPQPWVHSHNSASTDSTPDRVVLYVFIGKKKSACKWTCTVQTCAVQGSSVYIHIYMEVVSAQSCSTL